MDLLIIGNCQTQPISEWIRLHAEIGKVWTLPIHLYGTEIFKKFEHDFLLAVESESITILSQHLSSDFGAYSTERMRSRFSRFFTFSNIHFNGLHPDITYLGDLGERAASPLGDYHSKIILDSYVNGLSEAACRERFSNNTYDSIGYYEEYNRSATELLIRDEANDIRFAKTFLDLVSKRFCMYSINHPAGTVFSAIADEILDFLGFYKLMYPYGMGFDFLSESQWWPIYPEIVSHHNLPYSTPLIFKQSKRDGGKSLTLDSFIGESYVFYRANDPLIRKLVGSCHWHVEFSRKYLLLKAASIQSIRLGFSLKDDGPVVLEDDGSHFINLAYYSTSPVERFSSEIKAIHAEMPKDASVILPIDNLNLEIISCIKEAGFDGLCPSYEHIKRLIEAFTREFMNASQLISWVPSGFGKTLSFEDRLYLRYGIVELRVVESWLTNSPSIRDALRDILINIDSDDYIRRNFTLRDWLTAVNSEFNILKLMTNAGFYLTQGCSLDDAFDQVCTWAKMYFLGLSEANYLFPAPGAYPFFLETQHQIYNATGKIGNYICFPDDQNFYKMIEGRNILFVTPFADSISENYRSGRIFNLYNDIEILPFKLTTIYSPLSTYPNRPDLSSKETLEKLKRRIDATFEINNIDLFTAACGCYGVLLCAYVHDKYRVSSVYYGNHMNTLFGVRQQCSEDGLKGRINEESWVKSDLSRIPGVSYIDGGRYI